MGENQENINNLKKEADEYKALMDSHGVPLNVQERASKLGPQFIHTAVHAASYIFYLGAGDIFKIHPDAAAPVPQIDRQTALNAIPKDKIPSIQGVASSCACLGEDQLPLVASASGTTARTLIALQDMGVFTKSDEKVDAAENADVSTPSINVFDIEIAQYIAITLCGTLVHGGHHSVLEIGVIYNRLLTYHAEKFLANCPTSPNVPDSTAVANVYSEYIYKAGDYNSFIPKNMRNVDKLPVNIFLETQLSAIKSNVTETSITQPEAQKSSYSSSKRDLKISTLLVQQSLKKKKSLLSTHSKSKIPEQLEIQDCGADGDCLFLAIANQAGEIHIYLRQLTVAALASNRDRLSFLFETEGSDIVLKFPGTTDGDINEEQIKSLDRYLELMALPGTWGGEIELAVLAQVLNRPIAVITLGYHPLVYPSGTNDSGSPLYLGEPIFIHYNGTDHYQALKLKANAELELGAIFNSVLTEAFSEDVSEKVGNVTDEQKDKRINDRLNEFFKITDKTKGNKVWVSVEGNPDARELLGLLIPLTGMKYFATKLKTLGLNEGIDFTFTGKLKGGVQYFVLRILNMNHSALVAILEATVPVVSTSPRVTII